MTSPAIRFAGFTDDWEEKTFGELLDKADGVRRGPFGSAIKKEFFVKNSPYTVYEQYNAIYDDYDTRYNITKDKYEELIRFKVCAGDFIMSGSGTIGCISRVPTGVKLGIINQALIRIKLDHDKTDSDFFLQWIRSAKMQQRLTEANPASAMVNLVPMSEVRGWDTNLPSLAEQKAIGSFFTFIDRLITLHQREHDKTVNIKKALLEKIFPKDGNNKPEIRFAGFTGAWQKRKLGELALSFEYGLNAAATTFDGIHKYIRITDIDDETHEFKFDSLTTPDVNLKLADSYLLKDGDILFARTGASVGKTYQYREHDGLVYFAGFLIRARINPKYDSEFVFQNTLTRKYNSFIATTSQRSGQPGVNAVEYADYEILVPKLDEQKVIGIFLSKLDRLIAQHQRELTKLQNIKKALLEKMFV